MGMAVLPVLSPATAQCRGRRVACGGDPQMLGGRVDEKHRQNSRGLEQAQAALPVLTKHRDLGRVEPSQASQSVRHGR